MGGGPRTYPGGVSKWQWKRMQAKKGKQLLKARLCRERQIYEMRKRAELRAAVAQLERPWEAPAPAPVPGTAETLFSVSADEQVKALADRFRRPGGFDAWNDRDGPQIFRKLPPTADDGDLPSARFFPKGAVHSVKPYGITNSKEEDGEVDLERGGDDLGFGIGGRQRRRRRRRVRSSGESPIDAEITDSTRERDSSRLDSGDDSLIRNGDQMRRGVDGRANRNSRWRSSLRPTSDLSNLSINEDSNGKSDRRWSRYSSSNDRISGGRIGDL